MIISTTGLVATSAYRRVATALLAVLTLSCTPSPGDERSVVILPTPAGPGSAEAHLSTGPGGEVVLSWLEPVEDGVALRYSTLADTNWAAARTVARGDNWFVNWADFPSVTPIDDRLWAAHWLAKRPGGTYAYDVAIALSTDGGDSWSEAITPHTDGTRTEHGFVSLFPWQNGVGAMWLDGRNMGEDGHEGHSDGGSGMTLRVAVIGEGTVAHSGQLVDELVCDCCQTDVAVADSGPVAVYRNRTPDEIRDIHVARADDGRWDSGRQLSNDGWKIAGCPVNGPAIAADGAAVVTAWFTAANDQPRVRFARSADSGATFSEPIDIDTDQPLGRVDVALLENGEAIVSWLRRGAYKDGEIVIRRVSTSGALAAVAVVTMTSPGRTSGFPQMVRRGSDLVFAWTDVSGEASIVRTALLDTL